MQNIENAKLARVVGGAEAPTCGKGPNGVTAKEPKSTFQNMPSIMPTIGGPPILHPTIPCRNDKQPPEPSLPNPGGGDSTNPKPGIMPA